MAKLVVALILLAVATYKVNGHAALLEPPARNVMWRMGFTQLPKHPDDDYLICNEKPPGRCPPCGDHMDAEEPHPHEAGGIWATGIISRTYLKGQEIDVHVNVTRSHGGYMEFKICPNNNINSPVKQSCLDRNVLKLSRKGNRRVQLTAPYDGQEEIHVRLQLPADITCFQCVLQMTQVTEQFLPNKVMFRNCADIAVEESPQTNEAPSVRGQFASSFSRFSNPPRGGFHSSEFF